MRLIDGQALMQEFSDFVRGANNSDFVDVPTWNDAVSLLGSAPTIEPMRWIPCSKRLPEKDGEYLCCYGTRIHIGQMINGHFRHYGENVDRLITAWMPLPEPYKEET